MLFMHKKRYLRKDNAYSFFDHSINLQVTTGRAGLDFLFTGYLKVPLVLSVL